MIVKAFLTAIDDRLLMILGPAWFIYRQPLGIAITVGWLRRNLHGSAYRILDLGCGPGAACFVFALAGHSITAIDLERASRNLARRYSLVRNRIRGTVKPICWDLRHLDELPPQDPFDYVIATDVIEHIRNDQKFVRDLARLIRPGGFLLLTTPNKSYRGLYDDRLSETEDGGHVRWGYSEEDLRELFEPNALHIEQVAYFGGWVTQQLINLGRIANRILPLVGEVSTMFATYPLRVFTVLDRWIPYEALSIGAVARKVA